MKKIGYYHKVSLMARWFLPEKEAAVMGEDYGELLKDVAEPQARERFGSPWKAVKEVMNPREAAGWHLVLAAVLAFLFFPLHWVCVHTYYPVATLVMAAAAVGLLTEWFGGEKVGNPFRGLPKPLLVLFFVIGAFLIGLCGPVFFVPRLLISPYRLDETWVLTTILRWCVFLSVGAGVAGLLFARLLGRRWRVLTILAFTVICIVVYDLSSLQMMSSSFYAADYLFQQSNECVFIAAGGILAAVAGMR